MELIDKDAVVAEIERIEYETNYETFTDEVFGKRKVCKDIKDFLDTLEVKEVDLEKELDFVKDAYYYFTSDERSSMKKVAKHFFELGISVSNSTKVTTPDVDDVLKENGVNPDSKEAKIIKESYFMALEKLKA